MYDADATSRTTGWTIHHRVRVASTNDEAARLRDAGAGPRVAVVADEQGRGRGRGGRAFASPPGGFYVSLLVAAAPGDLPGPLAAAIALAAVTAVETVSGVSCGIKWPNDLWVGRRKLAGILLEAAGPRVPVVAGLGINVHGVPEDLPEAIRGQATALDLEAGRHVDRGALLTALLVQVDRWSADLRFPHPRRALERAWRERLLFVGERISYEIGGVRRSSILRDASLEGGLLVEDPEAGTRTLRPEHVRDLRPEGPEAGG